MSTRTHAAKLARIHKALSTNDDTILTEEEATLMGELRFAFELLLSGDFTQQRAVDELKRKYTIGDVTAMGRIRDAKQVFGDVTKGHRAMDAHIAYMRAEKVYMMAMGLDDSKIPPDLRHLPQDERLEILASMGRRVNLEVALNAINTMVKIRGLDKEESQLIDPAILERDTTISLNAQAKSLIKALLGQGVVNLSGLFENVPEAQELLRLPSPPTDERDRGEAEG